MSNVAIPHSTFLDYTSYGTVDPSEGLNAAYDITNKSDAVTPINVALVLPRANDPTALLASDWATRQETLASLNAAGTLWSTYGASDADYAAVMNSLQQQNIKVIGDADGADGYVTSQASRTIWVSLTPTQFGTLFGQTLHQGDLDGTTTPFWYGDLSLPSGLPVTGLWFDIGAQFGVFPASSNLSTGQVLTPHQGPQSIGNQLANIQNGSVGDYAGNIANWFYHFPLSGQAVTTPTIGLVEPGIGDAIPADPSNSFKAGLNAFRRASGHASDGSYYVVNRDGQSYNNNNSNPGERSLDVGVVASAAPGSTFGLYVGSGYSNPGAVSNAYTSYQAALWDLVNNPAVVSSSFSIFQQFSPDSPFYRAVKGLVTDAALRNLSLVVANNDFGSSYEIANGLANQLTAASFPYELMVGGTSLTTLAAAPSDPTVYNTLGDSLLSLALAGDRATLWQLIAAGLQTRPTAADPDAARTTFLESVWNTYEVQGSSFDPFDPDAGGGGVNTSVPTPPYQTAFGLTPTSANPAGGQGRGAPDVSADAGGNLTYAAPPADMSDNSNYLGYGGFGTSAATPLWASLIAQIDAIFADQGLPQLGYLNDLLYTAAAIMPASFNDITMGNNISSFFGGTDDDATLTGLGYRAQPGYDLVTGLGTPNGAILARALTSIAHAQISFADVPPVLESAGIDTWTSPVEQTLLVQTSFTAPGAVQVGALSFAADAADPFAWSSRMAEQALQPSFDPSLNLLFDKDGQGTSSEVALAPGQDLSVAVNSQTLDAPQATLTAPFGFMDFASSDGSSTVRLARPVAVAETAGGQSDQTAIVRMAQNGTATDSVMFYKVDDYVGGIDGIDPGDPGYAHAALTRAYTTGSGGTSVAGPGYDAPATTNTLLHVNAGDLIAMKLTSNGQNFYGFAQANETANGAPVNHLWNYGLNTWGFEDQSGGGDHDFNDVIVNLDFTSASGHGLLAPKS